MRAPLALLVAAAVLLSGCYHEDRWGPDDHRLQGTLSADFDDDNRTDLVQRATQRGATDVRIMESDPMQFEIQPLTESQCDNLRLELQQVGYVTAVGECERLL